LPTSSDSRLMNIIGRIGLWFLCLFLAVPLFSLLFSLALGTEAILAIIRVTMIFALPVACLYLPVVIAFKNAEGRKIWTILLSGILIGPLAMFLWSLILLLRGFSSEDVWHGDPLLGWLGGGVATTVFSLIVGFLTTSFYVLALKILYRRSIPSTSVSV
jgi:hypothetical protein